MKTFKQFLVEALTIDDLMKKSGKWPSGYTDVPRTELEVSLGQLQATQKDIDSATVSRYRQYAREGFQVPLPQVVLKHSTGKYLIIDGHHRVAAEFLKGAETIKVELVGEIE